jgi:ABC-type Fe3+-hydroxamate transport system substrate-binding protein
MAQVTDQIGNKLIIKAPKRVVSLVPSITYLLHSLQLDNEVVGLTRFCKLPAHYKKTKTIVGGTKEVNIERIKQLNPDFFLLSKEENTKELANELSKIAPVYVFDVSDCQSNTKLINDLGTIFDVQDKSDLLLEQIAQQKALFKTNWKKDKLKTVYFIWQNPWMTVGGDTFINEMMKLSGFDNIFKQKKRYPQVTLSSLDKDNIDVILLSSEPFPFKEKHKKDLQKQFPNTKIILVQGEPFTWYGSFPKNAFKYFTTLQKQLKNAH